MPWQDTRTCPSFLLWTASCGYVRLYHATCSKFDMSVGFFFFFLFPFWVVVGVTTLFIGCKPSSSLGFLLCLWEASSCVLSCCWLLICILRFYFKLSKITLLMFFFGCTYWKHVCLLSCLLLVFMVWMYSSSPISRRLFLSHIAIPRLMLLVVANYILEW